MGNVVDIKKAIREQALDIGFDAVGFAPVDGAPDNTAHLDEYLSQGRHGDMGWMAERKQQRAAPNALWDGAKTAIVLGLNYGPAVDPMDITSQPERGAISVYAQNRDYHDLVKKRLKRLARWLIEAHGGEVKNVFALVTDTLGIFYKTHHHEVASKSTTTVCRTMSHETTADAPLIAIDPLVCCPDFFFDCIGVGACNQRVCRQVKNMAVVFEHLLKVLEDFLGRRSRRLNAVDPVEHDLFPIFYLL